MDSYWKNGGISFIVLNIGSLQIMASHGKGQLDLWIKNKPGGL